jgi:hypothetical protein
MLTRDEILSKAVLKRETVTVPDLGGDVILQEMSGTQRDAWEQSLQSRDKQGNLVNARAKLVVATLVNEDGTRMFSDDDVDCVGEIPFSVLDRICDVALRLNHLRPQDVEEAKKN